MPGQTIHFSGFQVDLTARELRKNGVPVRLQDQPFQILAMLLERPGDIVTREEIQARLWADGTTVDFEHSVNAAIKRLRAALGDTAECPRFVETLHRRGYRFVAPLAQTANLGVPDRPAAKARLVVLPFDNLSHERAQDYFSDGLTEEMIAQLGRLFGSRVGVIARTSSMLLKGGGQTAREIGTSLRADYLMEGSVRRDGDRVRVTAQLIETRGETHLWAESYDRSLADVLAVQTDVASHIARSLMVELLPGAGPAPMRGTRNPDAYQAYLKGRFHWNRPADAGLQAAQVYFDEAASLDPSFAAAYTGLARCHLSIAEYYRELPRTALQAARTAAERALRCDAGDAEAHVVVAEVRRALDWDTEGAAEAYRAAFAANPSLDVGLRYYAMFLAVRGQVAEAIEVAERACDLDPFCLATHLRDAFVRCFAGEHEAVVRRCRDIIDMDERYQPARRLLAAALERLGRVDEALEALRAPGAGRPDVATEACLGHVLAIAGDRKSALAIRDRLTRRERRQATPAYYLALLHAGIGDVDEAFAELDIACEQRDPWLDTIAVDPRFQPLHGDARFQAILNRLQLVLAA